MMKTAEIRAQDTKELNKMLAKTNQDLRQLMIDRHTQEVKNVHQARQFRRRRARILTVLRERSLTTAEEAS